MHESGSGTSLLYFVVRARCRRKESSCSLSHLLMSFLYVYVPYFCDVCNAIKLALVIHELTNLWTWTTVSIWRRLSRWLSGLDHWIDIEGLTVSSLNCDRSLHLGLKAPELVMDSGCRNNRWTASLCTWPPSCRPLVFLPNQEVGSTWASLSLVGCSMHK